MPPTRSASSFFVALLLVLLLAALSVATLATGQLARGDPRVQCHSLADVRRTPGSRQLLQDAGASAPEQEPEQEQEEEQEQDPEQEQELAPGPQTPIVDADDANVAVEDDVSSEAPTADLVQSTSPVMVVQASISAPASTGNDDEEEDSDSTATTTATSKDSLSGLAASIANDVNSASAEEEEGSAPPAPPTPCLAWPPASQMISPVPLRSRRMTPRPPPPPTRTPCLAWPPASQMISPVPLRRRRRAQHPAAPPAPPTPCLAWPPASQMISPVPLRRRRSIMVFMVLTLIMMTLIMMTLIMTTTPTPYIMSSESLTPAPIHRHRHVLHHRRRHSQQQGHQAMTWRGERRRPPGKNLLMTSLQACAIWPTMQTRPSPARKRISGDELGRATCPVRESQGRPKSIHFYISKVVEEVTPTSRLTVGS